MGEYDDYFIYLGLFIATLLTNIAVSYYSTPFFMGEHLWNEAKIFLIFFIPLALAFITLFYIQKKTSKNRRLLPSTLTMISTWFINSISMWVFLVFFLLMDV